MPSIPTPWMYTHLHRKMNLNWDHFHHSAFFSFFSSQVIQYLQGPSLKKKVTPLLLRPPMCNLRYIDLPDHNVLLVVNVATYFHDFSWLNIKNMQLNCLTKRRSNDLHNIINLPIGVGWRFVFNLCKWCCPPTLQCSLVIKNPTVWYDRRLSITE